MIELTSLRYFTTAFETGTFSGAARANGVSQPTVSAAISRLEERLGGPLFRRSRTGLTPTALATALYHDAVGSVAHLSGLEARLRDDPQEVLRFHCAPDMLIGRMTPGLNVLRRDAPRLVLVFTDDPRESDVAYLSADCAPPSHRFVPLGEDGFGVAVARGHALTALPALRIEDLQGAPFIHRPYCPNADRMDLAGVRFAEAARAENDPQLLDLVAAGLGIAFVPLSHASHRNDIVILPLAGIDTGRRTYGLAHRKTAFATRIGQALLTASGHSAG